MQSKNCFECGTSGHCKKVQIKSCITTVLVLSTNCITCDEYTLNFVIILSILNHYQENIGTIFVSRTTNN